MKALWNLTFGGTSSLLATMITSCACNVIIKKTSQTIGSDTSLFLIYVMSAVALAPVIFANSKSFHRLCSNLRGVQLRLHFVRAATVYGSKLAWFFALTSLPLGVATTLYLTRAFFLIAWAAFAEKKRVSSAHWIALLTAFVGAIVALRPAIEGSIFGVLAALAAAVISAASAIQLKGLAEAAPPQVTTFILTTLMIPVAAPFAAGNWVSPPASILTYLLVAAGLSLLTQLLLVHAYANVPLVLIATSDFLYLFCSFAAGAIAFGEHIDMQSMLGGVLILAGSSASFFARERDLQPVAIERKMQ